MATWRMTVCMCIIGMCAWTRCSGRPRLEKNSGVRRLTGCGTQTAHLHHVLEGAELHHGVRDLAAPQRGETLEQPAAKQTARLLRHLVVPVACSVPGSEQTHLTSITDGQNIVRWRLYTSCAPADALLGHDLRHAVCEPLGEARHRLHLHLCRLKGAQPAGCTIILVAQSMMLVASAPACSSGHVQASAQDSVCTRAACVTRTRCRQRTLRRRIPPGRAPSGTWRRSLVPPSPRTCCAGAGRVVGF